MSIYLEIPQLNKEFPFQILVNEGDILTTPHWHREMELIYVSKGTINLGINDQPFTISEGEIVFINGGDLHYVLASPGSKRIVYQFDLNLFLNLTEDDLDLKNIFNKIPPLGKNWNGNQEKVSLLLKEIYNENENHPRGYMLKIKANLFEMILIFIRDITLEKVDRHQLRRRVRSEEILVKLDQIFKFVEQKYTERITLEEVSAAMGYSQFYFTKFFKKNTGKTFMTFLNDYRIDKAKWLLVKTSLSVSEIISEVGFESDKTFYRLFKLSMGMAPLDYRKRMQPNMEDI
ncbi:helix-turn-helix transcriptional regulator [Dellaglioa carnosa]|uniref:AraC family transcriptional regulator n=1 Tax=Dellaglioa carnosa TaxID=2995136 RepID=A0ABT4JLT5_9LACO|nr:AraC family transcriptional regulator [Dellaglioa carnosa]MCZ2491321.1 AraC family transcriptional regulator [Dellaglioa carnosa]MCZ2494399.1 AraC family transcriptional regulator [Dellaglioa carnosa]MDK1731185.1 AraC family transcriptional regulator [Dellaglioa carnosa]